MDFNPFVYVAFLKQIREKQWNSYYKKYSTTKTDESFAFDEVVQVYGKSNRAKKEKAGSTVKRIKNVKAATKQIKTGQIRKKTVNSNQIRKKNSKAATYTVPSKVRQQKRKPNVQNRKLTSPCKVKVIDIMKNKNEIIKQGIKVCTTLLNRKDELKTTLMSDSNKKHPQIVNTNNAGNSSETFSKRTRKKFDKENLPPKVHSLKNSTNNILNDERLVKETECSSLQCRRSPRLLNKNLRLNCVAVATKGLANCTDCMNNKGGIPSASSCRHKLSKSNKNKETSKLHTDDNSSLLEEPLQEVKNADKKENLRKNVQKNKILKLSNKSLRSSQHNKPVKEEIMLDSLKLEDKYSTRLCKKRKLSLEDNIKEEIPSGKIKNENSNRSINIPITRRQSYKQRLQTQTNSEEKVPKEEMLVENDYQGVKRTSSVLVTKSFSGTSENSDIATSTKRSRSSLPNKTSKPKQQMFIVHTFFKKDLEKQYPDLIYKSKRPSTNLSFNSSGTRRSLRNRDYSNSDEDFEPSKLAHSVCGTRKSLRNKSYFSTKECFERSKGDLSNIEKSTKRIRNPLKNKCNSEQTKMEISTCTLDNKTVLSEDSIQQSEVPSNDTSNTMQSISLNNPTTSSSTNESSNLLMVNKEITNVKDLLENDLKSTLGYKVFQRYQSQMLANENKENDYQYWNQAVKEELMQISKQVPLVSLQGYMKWSLNNYINSSSIL